MKPEPLTKDKIKQYIVRDFRTNYIYEKDVASAVEWLKKQLEDGYVFEIKTEKGEANLFDAKRVYEYIDEAFKGLKEK